MSETPLVSIVVPVYNVEKYIKKSIDSLRNQTLKNIEIILVDDGSTDFSGEFCDEYSKLDSRIKVIHKENAGLGLARNSGMDIATGDYIGFVDSDDFISTEMYELLLNNALRFKADISYCDKIKWYSDNQLEDRLSANDVTVYENNEIRQYLLNRIGMPPESKVDTLYQTAVWLGIYKRSIIEKYKIRFVSERKLISEDIIYNIDIMERCNCIVHSNSQLYYYRYTANSLTSKYKVDRFEKNVFLYNEMKRKLESEGTYSENEISPAIDRYLITYARIACMQEMEFEKQNGKEHALRQINNICYTPELVQVLSRYPYKKLPIKYAIICCFMKYRFCKLIMILLRLKGRSR